MRVVAPWKFHNLIDFSGLGTHTLLFLEAVCVCVLCCSAAVSVVVVNFDVVAISIWLYSSRRLYLHLTCCASLHSQDVWNAARINHKQKGATGSRPGPHGGLPEKTFSAFFFFGVVFFNISPFFLCSSLFWHLRASLCPICNKIKWCGHRKASRRVFYRRKSIRGVYALTLAWPLYSRANPFHKTKIQVAQLSLARHLRLLKRHKWF